MLTETEGAPVRRNLFTLEMAAVAIVLAGFIAVPAFADNPSTPPSAPPNIAPDMLPADGNTPTAPKHDVDDDRVTAQIRSALLADKSFSAHVRDVKIATNPDAVVLRGSVKSDEKDRIESVAQQFAGARQVINELLVTDL
jgi:hypothetical protein